MTTCPAISSFFTFGIATTMLPTITELQHALDTHQTTSEAIVAEALERIQSPDGQGKTTFWKVYADQAMAAAKASDMLRAAGLARSPLEGLPISLKDLSDKKGDIPRGASVILNDAPPATENALLVQRLL